MLSLIDPHGVTLTVALRAALRGDQCWIVATLGSVWSGVTARRQLEGQLSQTDQPCVHRESSILSWRVLPSIGSTTSSRKSPDFLDGEDDGAAIKKASGGPAR